MAVAVTTVHGSLVTPYLAPTLAWQEDGAAVRAAVAATAVGALGGSARVEGRLCRRGEGGEGLHLLRCHRRRWGWRRPAASKGGGGCGLVAMGGGAGAVAAAVAVAAGAGGQPRRSRRGGAERRAAAPGHADATAPHRVGMARNGSGVRPQRFLYPRQAPELAAMAAKRGGAGGAHTQTTPPQVTAAPSGGGRQRDGQDTTMARIPETRTLAGAGRKSKKKGGKR